MKLLLIPFFSLVCIYNLHCQSDNSTMSQKLIFESGKKYSRDFFESIICSTRYSEEDRVTFLKESIEKGEIDYLKYAYTKRSVSFKRDKKLTKVLSEFIKKEDSKENNKHHKLLWFSVNNLLDGRKELIDQYLKIRETSVNKYNLEGRLPMVLYNLGFEDEAIEFLDCLVEEYSIEVETVSLGFIEMEEKSNPFVTIGLLGEKHNREKVNNLAFEYFNKIHPRYYPRELGIYLEYLDEERYKKCIYNRWKECFEISKENSDEIYNFYQLFFFNREILAREYGMEYWNWFVEKIPLWEEKDKSYGDALLHIGKLVMEPSLSERDKKSIIDIVRNSNEYLKFDTKRTWSYSIHNFLIILINSTENPTKEYIEPFIPEKYKSDYGISEWEHIFEKLKVSNNQNYYFDYKKVKDIFLDKGLIERFEVDAYTEFMGSIGEISINTFLRLTNRIIGFDAESSEHPSRYDQLFENSFRPVFETCGFRNFSFSQTHEGPYNNCKYYLNFHINGETVKTEFTQTSDWFNVEQLLSLINNGLSSAKSELRLVPIETGDQTVMFGLFEPVKFNEVISQFDLN